MYIFNFCLFVLDIDEYTGNPCDINAACLNTNGSYECTCMREMGNHVQVIGFLCILQSGEEITDYQFHSTQFLSPHSISLLLQFPPGDIVGC